MRRPRGLRVSDMKKIRIKYSGFGFIWFASWLFTIGYLNLTFWKGVLAIIIWPYYIGDAFTLPPV
jgi:hypothetical protein